MSPTFAESAYEKAWEKRRKWTRTFTARLLNERQATVLAFLRRMPGKWPQRSENIGFWLQRYTPALFAQLHERLAALPDEAAREALPVSELFKP